jgi:hypothetical protein
MCSDCYHSRFPAALLALTAAALLPSLAVSCTRLIAAGRELRAAPIAGSPAMPEHIDVSILVYHCFYSSVKDGMTSAVG